MATIELEDLPEDVAETYRTRAELADKSVSEYVREHLIAEARSRERAEVLAAVRDGLGRSPMPGARTESILAALHELRSE